MRLYCHFHSIFHDKVAFQQKSRQINQKPIRTSKKKVPDHGY